MRAKAGTAAMVVAAAIAGSPGAADAADVYARMFPYAFATEAAAVEGCRDLTDADHIAAAGRGALVYLRSGDRARLVPRSGVPTLAYAVRDPSDNAFPSYAGIENRSGDRFSVVAGRQGQPQRGGVRCWFWARDGAYRLVSIEIVIVRPQAP